MRPTTGLRLTLLTCLIAVVAVTGGRPLSAQGVRTAAAAQGFRQSIGDTLISFDMVPVPAGTVTINGSPVAVDAFLIGRTEVTWDLYDIYAMGGEGSTRGGVDAASRPSQPYGAPDYGWGHAGYPAISIARQAAEHFCTWLSARTGRSYRLPTEAEWARAADLAAGGNSSADHLDAMTWHRGNAGGTTHPVGARKPDALGLSDLFGNAAEWVMPADGGLVTRGGSFRDSIDATGPAARALQDSTWNERDPQMPKSRWWLSDGPFVGFRIVTAVK